MITLHSGMDTGEWLRAFQYVHTLKRIILDENLHNAGIEETDKFKRNLSAICQTSETNLSPNSVYYRARKVGYGVNGVPKESDEKIIRMIAQNSSDRFQGFDAENSIPSPSSCKSGRTNKAGNCHVYLCESRETTIAEVKPIIGEYISIAEVVNRTERKIIDFTLERAWHPEESQSMNAFRQIIAWELQTPLKDEEYQFTQYLCDCFINMGYEGVRFSSAAAPGQVNISAFSRDGWYVQKSDLVQVKEIEYSTEKRTFSEQDREVYRKLIKAIDEKTD